VKNTSKNSGTLSGPGDQLSLTAGYFSAESWNALYGSGGSPPLHLENTAIRQATGVEIELAGTYSGLKFSLIRRRADGVKEATDPQAPADDFEGTISIGVLPGGPYVDFTVRVDELASGSADAVITAGVAG
jgi:hypothetical protein